jgi:ubiquinone/menaquinone biosynthesis C-methylase UbiE
MFHPDGPSFAELLRQALTSTERGYDLLAPKFDHTPFRTPEPILEGAARVIGGPIRSALDVCCGTGAALRHLRPLCTERVVGLDFSAGMLEEAKRRLEGTPGSAELELVRGDAFAMEWTEAFDVVTCFGALGHVVGDDEDRFLAGIARALRPGGRFVFATSTRPSPSSASYWMAHGFNAVMHVRNKLVSPPFVMFYLTFLWPEVRPLLERHGFGCEAVTGVCEKPWDRALIVVATKG